MLHNINKRAVRCFRRSLCELNDLITASRYGHAPRGLGAIDTGSGTRSEFQEYTVFRLPLLQTLERLLHVGHAGERHDLRTADLIASRNPRDDAALNWIERALARRLGLKSIGLRGRHLCQQYVSFVEPELQILKRKHHVEKFGMLLGFLFLGDARADEHDPNLVAVMLPQQLAVSQQRRKQGRDSILALGMILPDEVHDRRTGG